MTTKMSLPRLPFLYPHLFKSAIFHETSASLGVHPLRQVQKAGISTTKTRKQETYAQRYGTAAEPQPPPPGTSMPTKPQDNSSLADAIEKEVKQPTKPEEQKKIGAPPTGKESARPAQEEPKDQPDSSRDDAIEISLRDPTKRAIELNASKPQPKEIAEVVVAKSSDNDRKAKSMETVSQMGAPTVERPEEHRAPHLQAPPYVHHFDTFTLVRDLGSGGFTEDQSVTIMKAVRGLLAVNLDVAKEGLVSKSDVENV